MGLEIESIHLYRNGYGDKKVFNGKIKFKIDGGSVEVTPSHEAKQKIIAILADELQDTMNAAAREMKSAINNALTPVIEHQKEDDNGPE